MSRHTVSSSVCGPDPGHDGFWFLEQVRERYPDMAVVLVTGVHDVDWALRGLQHGVVDYLLKPFDQRSLSRALENGMRQHRLRRADRLLREQRASELGARHARLVQAMTRLQIVATEQVEAALDLVAYRNDVGASTAIGYGTCGGARHVGSGAGCPHDGTRQAALLQTNGRLVLPDALLNKGELTTRSAPCGAACRTRGMSLRRAVAAWPAGRHHPGHGSRIAGGDIPANSQGTRSADEPVLAVADSYDAMRSPRSFRDARTCPEQAVMNWCGQWYAVRPRHRADLHRGCPGLGAP